MSDDPGLTFSERIDVPAAAVYNAFTNAAALPPEFVARKASYLHLGQWLMSGLATHSRDHFVEMRAAIAAARESVDSEQ